MCGRTVINQQIIRDRLGWLVGAGKQETGNAQPENSDTTRATLDRCSSVSNGGNGANSNALALCTSSNLMSLPSGVENELASVQPKVHYASDVPWGASARAHNRYTTGNIGERFKIIYYLPQCARNGTSLNPLFLLFFTTVAFIKVLYILGLFLIIKK